MDSANKTEGLLSPFRVLDLTDELGFLCGKILGDLGADVIKIERPGGDPARRLGPFYKDERDPEKSLTWFGFNNNKRGVTLDLEKKEGQNLFAKLAAKADFVIETFTPGYLDKLKSGYAALAKNNPRLVWVSITPFGQPGPSSKCHASDIEIMALSGCMSLTGDPDRPPLRVTFPQSYSWTGSYAAVGALPAHYYRALTGEGQQVDVSAQATLLWAFSHAHVFWDLNRHVEKRAGSFMTGRSITGALLQRADGRRPASRRLGAGDAALGVLARACLLGFEPARREARRLVHDRAQHHRRITTAR